eukprot:4286894-Amphidinium_carterae.1
MRQAIQLHEECLPEQAKVNRTHLSRLIDHADALTNQATISAQHAHAIQVINDATRELQDIYLAQTKPAQPQRQSPDQPTPITHDGYEFENVDTLPPPPQTPPTNRLRRCLSLACSAIMKATPQPPPSPGTTVDYEQLQPSMPLTPLPVEARIGGNRLQRQKKPLARTGQKQRGRPRKHPLTVDAQKPADKADAGVLPTPVDPGDGLPRVLAPDMQQDEAQLIVIQDDEGATITPA